MKNFSPLQKVIDKKIANYLAEITGKPMYDFKKGESIPRMIYLSKEEISFLESNGWTKGEYLGVTILCKA